NHANGQYGHVHDFHKFETFANCAAVSMPQQLKAQGYRTAHIGKLHVAPESVYQFDRWLKSGPGRDAERWVEACRPLFEEESAQPFCVCFWTSDPHRSGDEVDGPECWRANRFGNPAREREGEIVYDPETIPVPAFLPDTPECRRELAQYYQSCSRVDR